MTRSSFEVAGNRLEPIVSGRERREALLALIEEARESLRLLYYIYAEDGIGTAVRDALIVAARRGIAVSLIIDGFGSSASSEFLQPLEASGASTCRFIPRLGRRYLLRNHQKMAIADGRRALIGGFNIEDGYFDDAHPDGWRDFGLAIEGPAVDHLAGYFDALSEWSRRPRAKMRDLRRSLSQWSDDRGPVRWLLGGPTRRLNPWLRTVKNDLAKAARLDMITAYFAPNPAMLRRIGRIAARRETSGGWARLMTAGRSDNDATIGAARHCYRRLLRRGVEIREYQRQRLHTKLLVIDDIVYVGSANFDMRSLFLNLEIMLRVEDATFADSARAFSEAEGATALLISRADHKAQSSWSKRLRWRIAYFIVAVLDSSLTRRISFGTAAD